MTIARDERDELDPVQQLVLSPECLHTRVPTISSQEFVQQYKKKILAKHRERIRDGFEEQYLSKRSKLSPVEKVDQLIRYNRDVYPLIFGKMVQAQEEAIDKLYERGMMLDSPFENFCGSYGSLTISP